MDFIKHISKKNFFVPVTLVVLLLDKLCGGLQKSGNNFYVKAIVMKTNFPLSVLRDGELRMNILYLN